jgi:hypothetical protein
MFHRKKILTFLLISLLAFPSLGQKRQVPRSAAKPAIPTFSGVLRSDKDKQKFDDFLSDNERKIVSVHFFLDDKEWESAVQGLINPEKPIPDKDKVISICLCWKDKDGAPAGSELVIDLSEGENDLVINEKAQSIKAYLKVIDISGPQMGLMAIYTKPVLVEKALGK